MQQTRLTNRLSENEKGSNRAQGFSAVMTTPVDIDAIMNQPERVRAWRRVAETVADKVGPLVDLSRPYVDGFENLPRDGRFLLVGNHTQGGVEAFLPSLLPNT
jgi:hypothetical protein